MTERRTADTITDDVLDQLYADRDQLAARVSREADDLAAAQQRRDELAATLARVLSHFVHKGHPGEPCLQTGWIAERTVAKWRAVLYRPAADRKPLAIRTEPQLPSTTTLEASSS